MMATKNVFFFGWISLIFLSMGFSLFTHGDNIPEGSVVDFSFRVMDSRIGSAMTYYTDNPFEDNRFELYLDTVIENPKGHRIDSVKATLPDSSIVTLVQGDGYGYMLDFDVEEPVSGEFVFEAVTSTGIKATQSVSYDNWYLTPFDYVSPRYDEVVSSNDDLVFEWSYPLDDVESFEVWFNDDSGEIYRKENIHGTSYRYRGPRLDDGIYSYRVVAKSDGEDYVHAKTRFEVGTPPPTREITWVEIEANTGYWIFDSEPDLYYWVGAYVEIETDDYTAISSVKVICPNDNEYDLEPEWDEGNRWDIGRYSTDFDLEEPQFGTYRFEFTQNGTTVSQNVFVNNWITEPFNSHEPTSTNIYMPGEVIHFTWDHSYDLDRYGVRIWSNENEYEWDRTSSGNSVDYVVPDIEEGVYRFTIFGENYDEFGLRAEGEFVIGEQVVFEAEVRSNVQYDLDDPQRELDYSIRPRIRIFVNDYSQLDYVRATAPGMETVELERWWDEGSSARDIGEFGANFRYDNEVSVDILFEFSYEGQYYSETVYFDEWLTIPFSYIEPSTVNRYDLGDTINFNWVHPESLEHSGVQIWSDNNDFDWGENTDYNPDYKTDDNIDDNTVNFDVLDIDEGIYWYRIWGRQDEAHIEAEGRFIVGPEYFISSPEVWSWTHYDQFQPRDMDYSLGLRLDVYSSTPENIEYVLVVDPNGDEHFLYDYYPDWDEPAGDGVYIGNLDFETPLSGEYTFVVSHSVDGLLQTTKEYNGWITELYSSVSPFFRQRFTSSEDLVFTWSHDNEDIEEFKVVIWHSDSDDEWSWSQRTTGQQLIYSGDPLRNGDYEYRIKGFGDNGDINVKGEFVIRD